MARALTDRERAVLGHVVVDVDAWWNHVSDAEKIDEESAIAAKVERWQASYDAAVDAGGYQVRADRTKEEPAQL